MSSSAPSVPTRAELAVLLTQLGAYIITAKTACSDATPLAMVDEEGAALWSKMCDDARHLFDRFEQLSAQLLGGTVTPEAFSLSGVMLDRVESLLAEMSS
jgi:hypothetical protein